RSEEEPEPDEDPGEESAVAAPPGPMVPAVGAGTREVEYRTELVTAAQVVDGSTLAEQLTKASGDGWDLVEIIQAGDRYAILFRRPKTSDREARRVGFLPPPR
ncbi:MAG: hypothetical protein M3170_01135, partial [Candidatus Dormibacteraeota bacterium]|nr:hypothetical protein [Candidatus Dormibacteraeota bacterium]